LAEEPTRKLAAIMFTDMVGFTSLSQENEALSISLLDKQREIVRPILHRHRGREIKTIGDAFLVEFPSALDAVMCAQDIQTEIKKSNKASALDRAIHLRIGIHLGDVVESKGDIVGDTVNIASRIEALADDDGVCVTRQVYDHVWNKSNTKFQTLGLQNLKHVTRPIEVFKIIPLPAQGGPNDSDPEAMNLDRRRLAVMPFVNMSPDPNDSYFADGMTEEIISTLSNVGGLSIISRTSIMGYKGSAKNVRQIAEELQVGSVLEGSLRKAGNRIRISTQLIDTATDRHVWAQNFDRELNDVFVMQSEIAEKVAEALMVRLVSSEGKPIQKTHSINMEAYNLYLKARHLMTEASDSSIKQALELLIQATKLDASFTRAYIALGECYSNLAYRNYISFDESVSGIRSAARKALEIEPDLADAHYLLALVAWFEDERDLDEIEATRAVELNPNLAEAQNILGIVKASKGYPLTSIKLLEKAHSLNPLDTQTIDYLGRMYIYMGRDADFYELANKNLSITPFVISILKEEFYCAKGDYTAAEKEQALLEGRYPNDFRVVSARAKLAALRSDRETAEKTVEQLKRDFSGGATLSRHIAIVKYYLGDTDGFFQLMEQAAREHVLDPALLRYSPLFENARKDPRYREVMIISNLDPELKE